MKITTEFLTTKGACSEGAAWFAGRYGAEAEYQAVLDTLASEGRMVWASWLLRAAGPASEVREIDGDLVGAHVAFAGHLIVRGGIVVRGSLLAGGEITAGGGIRADGGITAGGG